MIWKNNYKNKFVLMIAGEAKSGKSTFINAFLGKEILPTDAKQCTNSIIKIRYGEKLSLILKYMNSSRIITNFEKIRKNLKEGASIDDKYRDLPVFLINNFILKNKDDINEKSIKDFIKSVEKENIYGYCYEEYSQKIKNYIQNKQNWDKIVTEIEISYPFENEVFKNVIIVDSPGVNAEGRLGDITNKAIKYVDAIIFMKPIIGQALELNSFIKFIEKNTNNKDKENVFLLLTHSSSETKEKLEILKKEAVKIYGNKVNTQQIEYLDSKVQLFINEIKNMDSKEIEEYLEKLEKEGLYFNFMTPPINMKKFNKADYIKYLEDKSNFSNAYKDIVEFINRIQYQNRENSKMIEKNSYNDKKKKVLELNKKFQEIIEKNDVKEKVKQIQKPVNGLDNQIGNIKKDKFVLMIAGEAKSGKSTFINAYLGEDILPMDVKQRTSSIIEIKYGEEFSLLAKYAGGRKEQIKGKENIAKFLKDNAALNDDYRDIPVPTINNEILVKYKGTIPERVINDLIKGVKEDNIYNLFEEEYNTKIRKYIEENKNKWQNIIVKMVISYPFKTEELRNIEIIDSPGVNAAGHVGDVSENYIEKANAIMFLKPITGQALESTSFKKFLDTGSVERNKGILFLILTRAVNENAENLKILKKEAKRIYGSKIREEQIVAVDSKVQMFVNKISEYETYDDIEEYLDELEEKKQFEDFMNPPRRMRREKSSYIEYLTEKSRFKDINEAIEKFARKSQYYALDEVVKGISKVCKTIEESMKYDMKLYESKITKDPIEFAVQIDEIKTKINEINIKIGRKLDEVREKYVNFNPKGIILTKAEEKILELRKEIGNLNAENDDSINELEKISLRKIEEQKEFQKIMQRDIVEEYNREFNMLIDRFKARYPIDRFKARYPILELNFTEEDFKNMEDECRKDASEEKSYETGIIFKKTHFYSEYSRSKHFEILKENILGKMNKIQIEVVDNLIDFANNISSEYVKELIKNANEQKQKLNELLEEKVRTEEVKKQIEELKHIIQEITLFENKAKNLREKIYLI